MDTGQILVIALSILLAVWYLVGAVLNRKRGIATYHWIREGLREVIGEISEGKWLGTAGTGARLAVANARAPFRQVEVGFLLAAREILPVWLFNILRGKGDEMVVKASLRSLPAPLEAGRTIPKNYAGKQHPAPAGLTLLLAEQTPESALKAWEAFLERYGKAIISLSVSRRRPHVVMRVALPALQEEDAPSAEFFKAFAEACAKANAQ